MKGIILAGGAGSRLAPLTEITNKHLLPVGKEPMIWHPVRQLVGSGIGEILVVTSTHHMGSVVQSLGSGKRFGCEFTYRVQEEAGGIAHALALAEEFSSGERIVVLLGDNIFEYSIGPHVDDFRQQKRGARVLLKEVGDPERFGVAALDEKSVLSIEEKPMEPKSNHAVVGCYMYDDQVFKMISRTHKSARGELEITAVNNLYIKEGQLEYSFVKGRWTDAGTFESFAEAGQLLFELGNQILNMTAWLITGGAGFIGSNFVRMASYSDIDTIVVLDALTYAGNLANIADLTDARRVKFHKGDICDATLVAELFETHRFDCVVHFAAESHVDRSILGPKEFLRTNIDGTYVLVEAARRAWQREASGRRFIHVSTDEVFGDLSPDDAPFTEGTPYRPSSPYAASKASSDHLVRAWQRTYGLPAIITNCGNNYGPWQFPEKLIPLMILNAVEGRELPVYGDGMQVRDWLHVLDHCRAIMTVIDKGEVGATYLIGGDNPRANLEVVQRICRTVDAELGRSPETSTKLVRHVTDRPGHDRRYALNSSLLRTSLGWHPRENFETALPALVRWYLEHKDWTDTVRSGAYRQYYERQYAGR